MLESGDSQPLVVRGLVSGGGDMSPPPQFEVGEHNMICPPTFCPEHSMSHPTLDFKTRPLLVVIKKLRVIS